jgi:hypothetical protein
LSPGGVNNFLFSKSSRSALRSTQPPIQWVPGDLSSGIKRPESEFDHSPPTIAEVKKMWIYTSTPIRLHGHFRNAIINAISVQRNSNYVIQEYLSQPESFLRGISLLRGPRLWSSCQISWLQIQRSRIRIPALPDLLTSNRSGRGPTQRRDCN